MLWFIRARRRGSCWNGVTVTPKDTVEIQGEVDKDWNSVEIDVKQIRKVNP